MGLKTKRIGIISGLLVLMFILVASARASTTIDLEITEDGAAYLTFVNMKPGDTASGTITVTGTLDGFLYARTRYTVIPPSVYDLAEKLTITVSKFEEGYWTNIMSETLVEFCEPCENEFSGYEDKWWDPWTSLIENEPVTFKIVVEFDPLAGNDYQADSMEIKFEFLLHQLAPEDFPWSNEADVIILQFDPEDLPWSNETDVIIFPSPSLPPIFSDFNITPTEIQLGDDLIISFVIENTNNHSYTWMSTTRIGDFFTQIIEIELESYESKVIWYRIIPHLIGAQYDVWIDGQTGTFMVIPPDPWPVTDEVDPVIIVVDPLEELSLKIDSLQDNIEQSFNTIDDALVEVLEAGRDLDSRIDVLETYSNEVSDQIKNLENKISNLQTNILYACIATAIIAILGAFLLIKRMN